MNHVSSWRRAFLGLCLVVSIVRGAENNAVPGEIVVLPRFVVTADLVVFSLSWHCKWPTQKSKITEARFTDIPKGGMMERAGFRNGDRLLKYDAVTLSETTGEWLAARVKQPWRAGEVHELLIERDGKKLSLTIEVTAKPHQPPEATSRKEAQEAQRSN